MVFNAWIFVCTSLLMSYFGQSAWLLQNDLNKVNNANPFFGIMPEWFIPIGIVIAAIIASQALISGIFSLVSQAI